ncbi:MAG TPA: choice-of-anchor tandem repeat GloVer-containing protein [Candidatus Cybelea sp.]|jgi:uncharacterized repeat protein (TIGR03803 family)|nr:choice-of-anchor tandem repeat GloVer-containing protein [Candidatus Cybelea sp.]
MQRAILSTYRVLYRFQGGEHGRNPASGLVDINGTFYGTTPNGGGAGCGLGCGTIYSITPAGVENVLHRFGQGTDGAIPYTKTIVVNGTLYGTTIGGGKYDNGTVYSISTTGEENVLHSFNPATGDGSEPSADLLYANGMLYGTTYTGGGASSVCKPTGCGTAYSLTLKGKERVLHRFPGFEADDGQLPMSGLVELKGKLYGTTATGGGYRRGIVFSLTTAGTERVLHSFGGAPDGDDPQADLIDVHGTLYGTTIEGGTNSYHCGSSCGTVFSITKSGVERVLHSFSGENDGFEPEAPLLNVKGTMYGTTAAGGATTTQCGNGCGSIYRITKGGAESVVYYFVGGTSGRYPLAGLLYVNGTLYGTAAYGGDGDGVVFALTL